MDFNPGPLTLKLFSNALITTTALILFSLDFRQNSCAVMSRYNTKNKNTIYIVFIWLFWSVPQLQIQIREIIYFLPCGCQSLRKLKQTVLNFQCWAWYDVLEQICVFCVFSFAISKCSLLTLNILTLKCDKK